jgi:hypothetical protein
MMMNDELRSFLLFFLPAYFRAPFEINSNSDFIDITLNTNDDTQNSAANDVQRVMYAQIYAAVSYKNSPCKQEKSPLEMLELIG